MYQIVYRCINEKREALASLFNVVPSEIEPRTQGQKIDKASPLLYQLSYGTL